jgi:hypothetical protein
MMGAMQKIDSPNFENSAPPFRFQEYDPQGNLTAA